MQKKLNQEMEAKARAKSEEIAAQLAERERKERRLQRVKDGLDDVSSVRRACLTSTRPSTARLPSEGSTGWRACAHKPKVASCIVRVSRDGAQEHIPSVRTSPSPHQLSARFIRLV